MWEREDRMVAKKFHLSGIKMKRKGRIIESKISWDGREKGREDMNERI